MNINTFANGKNSNGMNKLRVVLGILLTSVVMGLSTTSLYAQTQLGSGSNAGDYQPPTDNPQNNVASGLQNTSSGLQPVSGQSGVNQQTLSGVSNLQVAGTNGTPNPNTTRAGTGTDADNSMNFLPYVAALGLVGLIVAGYFIARKNTSSKNPVADLTLPVATKPEPLPIPKNIKKSNITRSGKKKSSKNRKRKK